MVLHSSVVHPFRGVIHKLTEEFGGNVSEKGVVNVTTSSCFYDGHPINAVNLENVAQTFCSDNEPNSWLKYDFKNMKIRPTSYSIY